MEESRVCVLFAKDLFFGANLGFTARKQGYEVRSVRSAEEALAALRERPAVAIVDLGAPREQWEAVLRERQNDPGLASIPLVAFGSHVFPEPLEAARQLGATRVVSNGTISTKLPELLAELTETGTRRKLRGFSPRR